VDAEQTIAEIERLERIFAVRDTRPLSLSDISAANQRHDEMLAHSPWFRCGSITECVAGMKRMRGPGFKASAAFTVECQYQQVISYTNPNAATIECKSMPEQ